MNEDDFDDYGDDIDLSELDRVESLVSAIHPQQKAGPAAASTSKQPYLGAQHQSNNLVQRTLFGTTAPAVNRTKSNPTTHSTTADKAPKVKVVKKWDRRVWVSQQGWGQSKAEKSKSAKSKGKGKGKQLYDSDVEMGDLDDEDEDVDDEQPLLDGPAMGQGDPELNPSHPPPPMTLKIDKEQAKKWIYPLNRERRDYQFNIARRALFDNVLCSLPTGMGKTLIAAVVMLNFYRFFPEGKVIFVAPSKPLVAQQVEACHTIAGIPPSDVVEMTGNDAPSHRAEAWATKRVFYCTPQTVANDLKSGKCDPKKVVCLVVDEAHKASGNYAYCTIVRYLMQKNSHFRVLALTATPGANVDQVQGVIDALHIGHIEVRTPDSMDIQRYRYSTHLEKIVVKLNPDFARLRDKLCNLMKPLANRLSQVANGRIRPNQDPLTIAPFSVQTVWSDRELRGTKWVYPTGKKLHGYAQALQYLQCHSLSAFLDELKKIENEKSKDPELASLIREASNLKHAPGISGHPKMDTLKQLLEAHFEESLQNGRETKAIVFVNFRQVVEEVTDFLNLNKGIKATKFIGQGSDNKGARGFTQKEQQSVMAQFRDGKYNVMVATSIGEEGLDIGSVDAIFNYDAPKSSIRVMQRTGRTSRERAGKVYVLSAEGREETNWEKAREDYTKIQTFIVSGKEFELYADCDPLVPNKNSIECEQKVIDVTPFVRDAVNITNLFGNKRKPSIKKPKKDENRNIPEDGHIGFRTASEALKAKPSKAQVAVERKTKALLTTEQQDDLERDWIKPAKQSREGGIGRLPDKPDISFYELVAPKTSSIGASKRRANLEAVLKVARHVDADEEATWGDWEDSFWPHFAQNKVNWISNTRKKGSSLAVRRWQSCRTTSSDPAKAKLTFGPSQANKHRTQRPLEKLKSLTQIETAPVAVPEPRTVQPVFDVPDNFGSSDSELDMAWPASAQIQSRPIPTPPRLKSPSISPIQKPVKPKLLKPSKVLDLDPTDDEDDSILPGCPPQRVQAAACQAAPLFIEDEEIDELASSDAEEAIKPLPQDKHKHKPEDRLRKASPKHDGPLFAIPSNDSSSDYGTDIDFDSVQTPAINQPPLAAHSKPSELSLIPNSDPYDQSAVDFGNSLQDSFLIQALDDYENKGTTDVRSMARTRSPSMPPPKRPIARSQTKVRQLSGTAILKDSDPNTSKRILKRLNSADSLAAAWNGSAPPSKIVSKASLTSSSPVVRTRNFKVVNTPSEANESSIQIIRKPKRLRKLNSDQEEAEDELELLAQKPAKTTGKLHKPKKKRRMNAEQNPYFEGAFEAEESGSDGGPSDDPIGSEQSSDREFVNDASITDDSHMYAVYRASLFSQHPIAKKFAQPAIKQGYRFSRPVDHSFAATQRASGDEEVSQYEDSSFVVGDDEVEFEE